MTPLRQNMSSSNEGTAQLILMKIDSKVAKDISERLDPQRLRTKENCVS